MATFIAVSGPSSTGKTSIVDDLTTHKEFSKVKVCPDLLNTVWASLVEQGFFSSYTDIINDSEYICVYLLKMIEYYRDLIEKYSKEDGLVLLDCCWVDLAVYGVLNLWYHNMMKDLQADLLSQVNEFTGSVDKIYMTKYEESKRVIPKGHSPFKVYSKKANVKLELSYYNLFKNLYPVIELPTSDVSESALFIIDDLRKSGHL